MSVTPIQWTDRVWNCLRGCSRVSPGCRECYAEKIAARFSDEGQPFHLFAERKPKPHWTGKVALIEDKLTEPLSWRKPCRGFVNSMSDVFHEDVQDEWIARMFAVMALCPQHTFQILTKRADRMLAWVTNDGNEDDESMRDRIDEAAIGLGVGACHANMNPPERWPLPNVWLGVSVEDQQYADERIPLLLQTPAAIRFVSYEPALGLIDFTRIDKRPAAAPYSGELYINALSGTGFKASPLTALPIEAYSNVLDWVIVGGESGPDARPFRMDWAQQTVDQCRAAGVACFVKQLGARPIAPGVQFRYKCELDPKKGGEPEDWPRELRVREFPEVAA